MAFRIQSDAFIPAGGRPNTINGSGRKSFLLNDGKTPSSPLIVEGETSSRHRKLARTYSNTRKG